MSTLGDLIVKIGADPGNFQEVMRGIGDTVDHLGEQLKHTAENLTLLAEGLAITEALKEFGAEALNTYASIEKVSISLKALTGDAEEAAHTIERLKDVALSDALSFPALVQAQQRMTAFGFEAEKIPGLLQATANAAAATNKDFSEVADKIDRIVLSGTASAKQLTGLGLSLKDLGEVMGITADQVKTVFKELDESLRADIITAALQKYEGVAEEVAKGIAGQWTNLKTQIEFVFEDIGKALAPVVGQLLEFMNSQVLPYIRSLVEEFNNLSAPVKDAVVELALFLAAIVPIATALAGISLAIAGLSAVGPALAGIGAAAVSVAPIVAGVALAIGGIVLAVKELQAWIDQHPKIAAFEGLIETSVALARQGVKSLLTSPSGSGEGPESGAGSSKGPGEGSTSGSGEGTGPADPAIVAALVAQQQAAKAAAAAYQEMQQEEVKFHNSVVDLWNSLPATYDKYIATLENGGKSAKTILSSLETDLNRAQSAMLNMRGAPLQAMQEWVDGLKKAQDAVKTWADSDAASKLGLQVQGLMDKFPKQTEELKNADDEMMQFFDHMAYLADHAPDPFKNAKPEDLVRKLVEAQNQLDDSNRKVSDSFTKFYDQYEERTRKAIGITDDFAVKFGQLAEIKVDLSARLPADILEAYHAALELNTAYKELGITADNSGALMTRHIKDFNLVIGDSRANLEVVELAWSRVSGDIGRLAKTDLPAAIAAYDAFIGKLQQVGAPIGEILAAQEKELQVEIQLKELRGADATAEIIKLTQLQYQTKALRDASAALGDIYVSVRKTFDSAFASLEKGLADAIVNGKNLGDVFINVGKQIATSLLETVIKGALLPLQTELNKTGGMFDSLAKGIAGLFGKGGGAAPVQLGDVSGLVTSKTLDASKTATSTAGGASGAAGALGSVANIANIVGAAATVISGIVQGVQMAHLENLTGEIEVTTRKILNSITNGYEGTSLIESGTRTWQNLNVVIDALAQLHSDNVDVLGKLDDLIQGGGFGGGGGTGGGGLSALDLSLLQDLGSNLTNLTQTLSTQANSLIYGGGAGGTSISYAPISQSLAYSLPQAINTTTQAFANMRNPLDLVAQSLRGLPTALTGVADAASQMAPSPFAGGVPQQGPGGNNTYASILALTEGTGNISDELNGLRKTLADDLASGRTDAVALAIEDGLRQHIMQLMPYTGATLTTDTRGRHNWNASPWGQMPSAGIDVSAYTNTSLPMTPTPADPFTGGSSNFFPGRATVTVNALDVTGRSIADATIKGLREMGVKV